MEIFTQRTAMRDWRKRQHDKRVALVPTMGALHEGHLSLVRRALREADLVVVSIFVNPTQFGPDEDFDDYPRNLDSDLAKLRELGVAVAFCPDVAAVYPAGFDTYIEPGKAQDYLCGARRPGHFRGVCTVVHLLFQWVGPDVAVFGEKDFQQLQILKRMVLDLGLGVEIVSVPIHREADGLAMSSRNRHLSEAERLSARAIPETLEFVADALGAGEAALNDVLTEAERRLGEAGLRLDYLSYCDPESFEPLAQVQYPALLAVAVFAGGTRLIDNRLFGG